MDTKKIPQVGQILFQQYTDSYGKTTSDLIYIDEEPIDKIEGKSLCVTWLATMADFGNGLEVYTRPEAGGTSLNNIDRIASDEDILSFVNVIKQSPEFKRIIDEWINILETSEDHKPLLAQEKARLKHLLLEKNK